MAGFCCAMGRPAPWWTKSSSNLTCIRNIAKFEHIMYLVRSFKHHVQQKKYQACVDSMIPMVSTVSLSQITPVISLSWINKAFTLYFKTSSQEPGLPYQIRSPQRTTTEFGSPNPKLMFSFRHAA